MQKNKIGSMIFTIIIFVGLILVVVFNQINPKDEPEIAEVGYSSNTVEAKVTVMLEEGLITLGTITQPYQIVLVEVLEGEYKGFTMQIDHGKRQVRPQGFELGVGDHILVSIGKSPGDDVIRAYFVDYVRTNTLLILSLVFVAVSILISGWKGLRSILSIGVSLVIIFYYIIPRILAGADPIWVSLIGSFVFLAITQYLVYGWTLKTHIALAGILFSVLLTGLLSHSFVNYAYLSGFGDENAMYLIQQAGSLDTRNLLIASIIIGTLGVLDDLVIGQASAVIQLHLANPNLTFRQRFRGSMNIGRDHIAATVNTLLLAYIGASLSMFLLFSINNVDLLRLLNINYISEEIVRSLVGTLGLFAAVPITTAVACLAVDKQSLLEKLTRYLGPLTDEYGH